MLSYVVILTKSVTRILPTVPKGVLLRFTEWVISVESHGMIATRRISGFHDEPLKGIWLRQRSVRLNRSYRAIYRELQKETRIEIVVEEVTKHDYRKKR